MKNVFLLYAFIYWRVLTISLCFTRIKMVISIAQLILKKIRPLHNTAGKQSFPANSPFRTWQALRSFPTMLRITDLKFSAMFFRSLDFTLRAVVVLFGRWCLMLNIRKVFLKRGISAIESWWLASSGLLARLFLVEHDVFALIKKRRTPHILAGSQSFPAMYPFKRLEWSILILKNNISVWVKLKNNYRSKKLTYKNTYTPHNTAGDQTFPVTYPFEAFKHIIFVLTELFLNFKIIGDTIFTQNICTRHILSGKQLFPANSLL